ncbi:MAG: GspH/FimT family pseudopilin [Marinobacter sp.]|nr:GspH/FimT family pseudopilin [Marinobacter sp.]
MKPAKPSAGFTLVELLVVIALISLIASYTIPSVEKLVDNSRRHASVSDMVMLINLARNSAILEQVTVTLCPLDETDTCTHDWNTRPITIFRDPDSDRALADDSDIIRVSEVVEGGEWDANTSSRPYFRFFPSGMASYAVGNMIWCPKGNDSHLAAQIVVNMGGRLRLSEDQDGDGMIEDANGHTVTCS